MTKADKNPPKPVHPRNIKSHGLFGMTFIQQHMIKDDAWTLDSLIDEFHTMSELLGKRTTYLKMEKRNRWSAAAQKNRRLKNECRAGRANLQRAVNGNFNQIHNIFISHKDMQRLYKSMPEHLVAENINQRTFVLRKERDRLKYRCKNLKVEYKNILYKCYEVLNRIENQEDFRLPEEKKIKSLIRQLENSKIRFKAIKTINSAYKKVIHVLRHDEIFYDPILNSLTDDIDDQATFIKHILHIGSPAITRYRVLNDEYRTLDMKYKKELQQAMHDILNAKKPEPTAAVAIRRTTMRMSAAPQERRYVRETNRMMFLKNELTAVSNMVREIKTATLSSRAREIFPRIKSQIDNNTKLLKKIGLDTIGHRNLEIKMKRAAVYEGTLLNKEGPEQIHRNSIILFIEERLEKEKQKEIEIIDYMKNRNDIVVELRLMLWKLNDILWYVGRPPRIMQQSYPTNELSLPLLRFEMINMRAVPPIYIEENVTKLLNVIKKKMETVVQLFNENVTPEDFAEIIDAYDNEYIDITNVAEEEDIEKEEAAHKIEEDEQWEIFTKMVQAAQNRKQMKVQSMKIVDEHNKKDE
ncbi:uncharacterized protein LOC119683936 [Teleopsis dalmanni]|uniref:uncharacterized protein LOC119683936 n=1 Tax=Teleopsis dalmanni TaxID=139649 RepID=UPI0018CD23C7|nr:uncharacterized protein LOC119683936 [Teleopsis dalmanni]